MADLTPTQDLILEVLAARARLGEHHWTFSRRHRHQILPLADQGLVTWDWGNTEGVIRVWLTDAGRAEVLDADYVNPVDRRVQDLADDLLDVSGMRWWLEQARLREIDPDEILAVAKAAQESIREWGRLIPKADAPIYRKALAGSAE